MQRTISLWIIAATAATCGGCIVPSVRITLQSDTLPSESAPAEEERSSLVARAEPLPPLTATTSIEPTRIVLSDAIGQPVPDQPDPGQPVPDQPVPDQPVPGQPVPGQPVPNATIAAPNAITEAPVLQRTKSIREISLDITPPQLVTDQNVALGLPQNYAATALPALAAERPFTRGDLLEAGYEWHPSPQGLTFCYQPLYFEDANLERYGRSWGCLQPFVSAAHFYSKIPALPYMVFAQPARRCTYHAHWTLPGYKIPRREPQPLVPSLTGAAAEVAVIYGIVLLIP